MEGSHPPKADKYRPSLSALGGCAIIKYINIMYYVYIIYSQKLNKKYIGFTSDLKKRIINHNSGYSEFTSKGIPWELIYYESFLFEEDAIREEKFLKTGKGRERIKNLFSGRFA